LEEQVAARQVDAQTTSRSESPRFATADAGTECAIDLAALNAYDAPP
jgi:hypothetical protein